jgi:hypothetical protein
MSHLRRLLCRVGLHKWDDHIIVMVCMRCGCTLRWGRGGWWKGGE